MRKRYSEGDMFIIPMKDGRFAACQIICALKGRFKKAFSFGVIRIVSDETVSVEDGDFLHYSYGKRESNVIFASPAYLRDGTWKIVGNIPLTLEKEELRVFQCAGHLYCGDEYIRNLQIDEYSQFNTLGVAGFELVQIHLSEMKQ
ncbi:immunity 26/phosphotriesterase HocA family protein [Paenibacillus pabuli]|uniref:immunity 26/phosphotriesterase HocA family protein n=2 Tax=Paenibacillus TaxID=44249 RepID=UPI002000303A|nr:immunity 26/phosphotriesterase HocA family protein [Paenibacillus pabuli]